MTNLQMEAIGYQMDKMMRQQQHRDQVITILELP